MEGAAVIAPWTAIAIGAVCFLAGACFGGFALLWIDKWLGGKG